MCIYIFYFYSRDKVFNMKLLHKYFYYNSDACKFFINFVDRVENIKFNFLVSCYKKFLNEK